MKTVLFTPPYKASVNDLQKVFSAFERKGYSPQGVPIDWNATMNEWIFQLQEAYRRCDPANTVLAGYSVGAMVDYVVAARADQPVDELWLCSCSGLFAEDLPDVAAETIAYFPERQLAAFRALRFADEPTPRVGRSLCFMGEEENREFPWLAARMREISAALGTTIHEVPGVGHNLLSKPAYLDLVERTI